MSGAETVGPQAIVHGPPGSRAPEVARFLAESWGVSLRETDSDVEQALGAEVAEIFVTSGEASFRTAEADAVRAGLRRDGEVLLIGSGAITQPDVVELLRPWRDRTIFVDVSLTEAARRLGFVGGPGALGSPRSQWQLMMTQRRPVYQAVSGVVLGADEVPGELDATWAAFVAAQVVQPGQEHAP